MTMTSVKKKESIADEINEILKPKELTEETDEVEAKFEEFNEFEERDSKVNQVSDIRRQTARSLSELDSKYKGKVVSRKELEAEDDISDSSDNDDDLEDEEESDIEAGSGDEVNDATDSGEEHEEDEEDQSEASDEDDSNASEGSDEDDDDDFQDDFDISQYAKPQNSSSSATSPRDIKSQLLKSSSLNEEIKKGFCVQNQLKIWEKLLEVRIKSQKMLITANSLPSFDDHLELSSLDDSTFSEKVEKTCDGVHRLLDNLLELQSTLVNR